MSGDEADEVVVAENAKLIDALNARGGGGEGPSRPEKLSKLNLALRKSFKVKEFKEVQECTVKEWLKRFDQEVGVLKKMSGIDDDLSNTESVELLRDKLEYSVVTRLNTAFRNSGKTWATITYADLHKTLKEEYGSKMADVYEVLI